MTDGHKRHLMATLLAIEEASRQIEQVAREGRSPSGNNRLTPLDPASWAVFADALQHMYVDLQACIKQLLPQELAEQEHREGLSVTLYWLSVLLLHLDEEIVEDLDPKKTIPKFGPLEPAEREALEAVVARLHEAVERMRRQIERLRHPSEQE
ncbi:hypothetical protein CTKA_02304 [Chthonomonas calidirosea]|uniref:Uncharacterized protein n=1 Tax=Chthonomonas calidirosea (strain DSM 23976 / ICMP 18418 / T49) TaxID=1303518 RepID=S0EV34_CHTCT|nr:hypothetical protein [Chthonomonas calidirosea]CCW35603.1 hypothetical protein CCALI_01790 [Chthonomonas calidirosea T49]CEK19780.1 hypothetical protein CTKA_02304 [Chthonomonas calidirosea]